MARMPASLRKFSDLVEAVVDGNADHVRQMLAEGHDPNLSGVEESGDMTPLMHAAALGKLEAVQLLIVAGADANAMTGELAGDDDFPFLDELFQRALIHGLTPLAYAAIYGHQDVFDFLASRTSDALCSQAIAIRNARPTSPGKRSSRKQKAATPKGSVSKAAREALLAAMPKLRRWINDCPLCGAQGFKPQLPEEIDRNGSAAKLRKLFKPLALGADLVCEKCSRKIEAGRRKLAEKHGRREAL